MKKTAILVMFTALIACNKNSNPEAKNTKVLWAENVQSTVPLIWDTLWDQAEWNNIYKYDKGKIFTTIRDAVYSGKLKAYFGYPDGELTIKEFYNILVQLDSTNVMEDIKNPDTMKVVIIKKEITPEDIVQIKFNEKIELDTASYILIKKVSFVTFLTNKYDGNGDLLGLKYLFDVKLND